MSSESSLVTPQLATDTDLIRKRSRSSSPGGEGAGVESPGAAKKANLDPTGPSNLSNVIDIDSSEDASVKTEGDAATTTATATAVTAGDAGAGTPMIIDVAAGADLPANPTLVEGGGGDTSPEGIAAAEAAAAAASVIQMRALIVTQDASIIIGKSGKNVNEIREKSGSKITISETVVGNPERVMMIAGQLDAVSKVRCFR